MARTREIKKRMVAVGTIQRITKTMQMIATAKFTAAFQRARATKPYTKRIRELVGELSEKLGDVTHPLLSAPEKRTGRQLLLVITSDRGLCGAYNANVLRTSLQHIRRMQAAGTAFDLETAGKKAVGFFTFQKLPIARRHSIGDRPKYEAVNAIASEFINAFVSGRYDAVHVASMRFISNARQVPEVVQLLPLEAPTAAGDQRGAAGAGAQASYEISPSAEALLDDLLPLAVKSQLFQCFNDAVVSEQIMRMIAMKAATENARDLRRNLNRSYNRARQAAITTELTEIVSGAAALE
ncbi:MAG: ATP synthase F1 subunit gamma [Phycisphaeraceae bacterium]|nr:ATP synthase F1 subunit gamma [Phycisphaeraceae bacterium]